MDPTTASDAGIVNLVLNAISTGGLVGALTLGIMAFVRGWVFPSAVVQELRMQIRELTAALKLSNEGMEKMADAWETRNTIERERAIEDRAIDNRTRKARN